MIKSFEEFINEKLDSNPFSGDLLPNGNYVSIDATEYKIRDGNNKDFQGVEQLTDDDYDETKIKNEYPDFIKAVYNCNANTKNPIDDYIYIIYGDDDNGYQFDKFDMWEFEKKWKK